MCVFDLQGWVLSPAGFYFCGTGNGKEDGPSGHVNWSGWVDDPSRRFLALCPGEFLVLGQELGEQTLEPVGKMDKRHV